jgi:replication-associated recombination protein RarA
MTFAEVQTPGGYRCGEVASAMQKCIRRGLADDALYWATELDLANFGEYVFKRLKIIASEDVGLADDGAAATVQALHANWLAQRKKDDTRHSPERLFLVHAVLYLARARKSRMVDHALVVMYEGQRDGRKIPDFALDRHTARGRAAKRAWKHFWAEGARLENRADLDDPYEQNAREIRRDKQLDLDLDA